jgi:hypothetical protein
LKSADAASANSPAGLCRSLKETFDSSNQIRNKAFALHAFLRGCLEVADLGLRLISVTFRAIQSSEISENT